MYKMDVDFWGSGLAEYRVLGFGGEGVGGGEAPVLLGHKLINVFLL